MTSHAFHSSMMESILEEFRHFFSALTLHAPQIPYVSNLTGTWITDEEATDPVYWSNHLRNTVRFADGMKTLLTQETVFVEVGPGKTLSSIAKRCGAVSKKCLNMIRHEKEMASDVTYAVVMLASLWKFGQKIKWNQFLYGKTFYRVSLPTYPFKGQKYNLICEDTQDTRISQKEPYKRWFYRPAWKLTSQKLIKRENDLQEKWLIFTDQSELSNEIVKFLDKKYSCSYCLRNNEFGRSGNVFFLNEEKSKDYKKLAEILDQEGKFPNNILYLWEVNQSIENVSVKKKTAFNYILSIIQEFAPILSGRKLCFNIITSDGYQVIEQDVVTDVMASLTFAFCKMVKKEYGNISCRGIDVIDYASQNETLIFSIINELTGKQVDEQVFYRNGLRFVEGYEMIEHELICDSSNLGICKQGVYLITGGLGDISLEIVEYLTNIYQAKVILTTRHEIPNIDELVSLSLEEQTSDRMDKKYKRIKRLIDAGAKIYVKKADVSDYDDMKRLVDLCEDEIGRIQGVFHIAGKEGNGIIQTKTQDEANKVLSPKVDGTLVLDKVFADKTLDLCVLFSSMATVYGEAGQVDYIAGNSFLNSYAFYATKKYPGRRTISINWDNWNEIGMAARSLEKQDYLVNFLGDGIPVKDGVRALIELTAFDEQIVYVAVNDIQSRKNYLEQISQVDELGAFFVKDGVKYERPEISEEYVAPRTKKEKEIAEIWQNVFSIQNIGVNDDFYELGGDSLYAINIVAQLKKNYEVDLSDIFNYPTIAMLANHIELGTNVLEQNFEAAKNVLIHYNELNNVNDNMTEEMELYKEKNERYEMLDYEKQKWFNDILLLGSTGYLGIYLLRELLFHSKAQIHAIVRGDEKRLYQKIISYFGQDFLNKYSERIHVYVGTISADKFGLREEIYKDLSAKISCIVNASGKVDHYGKYEDFYEANIAPVKEILKFAQIGINKEIHQMSTKGVAMGVIPGCKKKLYMEDDTDFGQEITNHYASTKLYAEKILLEARKKGIYTNIYRIGDIVFDTKDGRFQENIDKNAIYLIVRAMSRFACIPDSDMEFLEFTFVDFVSKAIVRLLMTESLNNETYHLINPYRIGFSDWNQVFMELKDEKNKVTVEEYLNYLKDNYDSPELQEYVQDFLTHTHILEAEDYTIFLMLQDRTRRILEKLSLKWEKPTIDQLISMMRYGKSKNFFKMIQ